MARDGFIQGRLGKASPSRSAPVIVAALLVMLGSPVRAQEELPPAELPPATTEAPVEEVPAAAAEPVDEEVVPDVPAPARAPSAERAPGPPAPTLQRADLRDMGLLILATASSGIVGAAAGLVGGFLLAALVAVPTALLVRFAGLPHLASSAGISLFLFAPPLLLVAGTALGYLAGRAVAPWIAPRIVGPRVRSARGLLRWGAIFCGIDVVATAAVSFPVWMGLAALGMFTGFYTAANMPALTYLGTPLPSRNQTAFFVGAAYIMAALVLLGPPLLVGLAGGVPIGSLIITGLLSSREAP